MASGESKSTMDSDETMRPVEIVIFDGDYNSDPQNKLDVPEEPSTEEEDEDSCYDNHHEDFSDDHPEGHVGEEPVRATGAAASWRPSGRNTPLTFFTAAGIARWVAKAYGYAAKKKSSYKSQDQLLLEKSRSRSSSARSHFSTILEVDQTNNGTLSRTHSSTTLEISRPPSVNKRILEDELQSLDYFSLTGNELLDRKLVCKWIATSYGEEDPEYHKAYSKEILRQARMASPDYKEIKMRPCWC